MVVLFLKLITFTQKIYFHLQNNFRKIISTLNLKGPNYVLEIIMLKQTETKHRGKTKFSKGTSKRGRLQTPSRGRYINQLWPERERARTRTSVSLREALCLPTIKDSPTWRMCMWELGIYSFDLANTLQNADRSLY